MGFYDDKEYLTEHDAKNIRRELMRKGYDPKQRDQVMAKLDDKLRNGKGLDRKEYEKVTEQLWRGKEDRISKSQAMKLKKLQ
jgi:hypothetical protein